MSGQNDKSIQIGKLILRIGKPLLQLLKT